MSVTIGQKLLKPQRRLVAEFVLVVLGVLVALTVDAWIEQRHDHSLRQQYLTRLGDDLVKDRQAMDYRISFFTAVRSFSIQTLERLQSDGPVDQDAVKADYYAAEQFAFTPIENTYEDLKNTGNIRLLDDMDLRLALASYHGKTDIAQPLEESIYREIVRGIIPWRIQALIREHCPTTNDVDEIPTGFPPCVLPGISAEEVNNTFESLRAYPGISEIITYHASQVDVAVYLYQVKKELAGRVLG